MELDMIRRWRLARRSIRQRVTTPDAVVETRMDTMHLEVVEIASPDTPVWDAVLIRGTTEREMT